MWWSLDPNQEAAFLEVAKWLHGTKKNDNKQR
jgi:hypothetical protein